MTEEAQEMIKTIAQMEASLDDDQQTVTRGLSVTTPLNDCLRDLKQKMSATRALHNERFEQVKKLVQALESYSLHLEPSFIRIKLPPTTSNTCPPNFDLSPRYVTTLDEEFTRVYEEYGSRLRLVQNTAEEIIRLYSELGVPQAQTDSAIVQHYRESPEQLGLHKTDIDRLKSKHEKLSADKKQREKRLKDLKTTVEGLWDRLGVEEPDRRAFLAANRGCGMRALNEFEEELDRLNELKRQNLGLFVEDARVRLQELWDGLFFSEEEMLDFTPAFSDVYSDALLSAHEAEIDRLQVLQEQRAPILSIIEKHRSLINDRDALAASANDASRLMARGPKGERRDPTRLLREEKMRKRIAKDLPKIAQELENTLLRYEDEYGRPFLVRGERYLDEVLAAAAEAKEAKVARSRTPNPMSTHKTPAVPQRSKTPNPRGPAVKAKAVTNTVDRSRGVLNSSQAGTPASVASRVHSPSKIPSRAPLGGLQYGGNKSPGKNTAGQMGPPRLPPPKMRPLTQDESPVTRYRPSAQEEAPPAQYRPGSGVPSTAPTPQYRPGSVQSSHTASSGSVIVRQTSPEDVYDDRERMSYMSASMFTNPMRTLPHAPPSRQISNTSSNLTTASTVSGSENWETYSEASQIEPEVEVPNKRIVESYGTTGSHLTDLRSLRSGGY